MRLLGLIPVALGAAAAVASPTPDLLVTGDGRHLVVLDREGTPLLLRERAGDYMRDLFSEASGYDGEPDELAVAPFSRCSRDSCVAAIRKGKSEWRLLATRSSTRIPWTDFTRSCAEADIVVSDRRLPRGCLPRWLKLDRAGLERSGGVAIYLGETPHVATVSERVGEHPWSWRSANSRSTPRARFRPGR